MNLLLENTGYNGQIEQIDWLKSTILNLQGSRELINKLIIDHFPLALTFREHITKLQSLAGLVTSKAAKRMIPKWGKSEYLYESIVDKWSISMAYEFTIGKYGI